MNDFCFYFKIGWEHIITIEALDHILFIAALAAIYLLRDWRQVLVLITAFTIGHTITLVLSTKQWVEVSDRLVEFLIPCTIAFTAVSNLFQKHFTAKAVRINYALALFFGLIHGLAFANTLRMILATDQSFALSMFSFSVGLECGQVLIVLLILLLSQLFIGPMRIERRHWVIFLSAAVFSLSVEMAVQRWPGRENTALYQNSLPNGKDFFVLTGDPAPMHRQWRRSVQQRNFNETQVIFYINTQTKRSKIAHDEGKHETFTFPARRPCSGNGRSGAEHQQQFKFEPREQV